MNKCFRCESEHQCNECSGCGMMACEDCMKPCKDCGLSVCMTPSCQSFHKIKHHCCYCDRPIVRKSVYNEYKRCCACSGIFCYPCGFMCSESGQWCQKCGCPHKMTCDCGQRTKCGQDLTMCDICHQPSQHTTPQILRCCSSPFQPDRNKDKADLTVCCRMKCKLAVPKYKESKRLKCVKCGAEYCPDHYYMLYDKKSVPLCRVDCYHEYISSTNTSTDLNSI